jgi:allene oxide cyclase
MQGKLRILLVLVACGLLVLLVVALATSSSGSPADPRVKVIEHATTDTVIDTGGAGDTSGDLLTFHNKVYGPHNARVVGHDLGTCIRINPGAGSWQCSWTTFLSGGQITVSGPFYDTRDSVLAIIGGTGVYAHATGTMSLHARKGGTEYAFIFNVS